MGASPAAVAPISAAPGYVAAPSVGMPAAGNAPVHPSLLAPYAGFWLRAVAYLVDSIILTFVFGALILVGAAIIGFGAIAAAIHNADNPGAIPAAIIFLIVSVAAASIIVSWLYYAWMESSASQATLGKLALGLYVTDLQGRRLSFGRASGRFFAKIITGLIPFFLGYILAGITEKKQALHDMIASCLVLRKN
ncbi:MAG: RDD family protein [Candidatus Acidiferrales bacterium]